MIFINYRRDDSTATAGRLHDRLAQTFGRKNLFMDVDHIPPGVDYVNHLNRQVAACDVFVAVIGPNWLDVRNEKGDRRLDAPDDFVTIEIAAALARDIRVIPVLVDGARLPKVGDLPEPLKPLARRQAIELRHAHFGRDAEALVAKIKEALGDKPVWVNRGRAVAAGVAALLLLGSIALFSAGVPISLPWTADDKPDQAERDRLAKEEEERKAKAADPKQDPAPARPQTQPGAAAVTGAQPALLGEYGDWGVYIAAPGGTKTCFALAKPKTTKIEPAGRTRDQPYVFVSTLPAKNIKNEVSVVMGYPVKNSAAATAEVGTVTFGMYTQNNGAWIKNVAEEARMVDVMRQGINLTVKGISEHFQSTDQYSLKGLAQALDRIELDCK
jgi:TIR domain